MDNLHERMSEIADELTHVYRQMVDASNEYNATMGILRHRVSKAELRLHSLASIVKAINESEATA